MLPRLWDLDKLLRSVAWLRLKNTEGRHIYIRPAGEHSLSLIDDASIQVVERLKSEGFAPAVVLETSPGNFQAWLRHGQILPKHLSTVAARLLATRFGCDSSFRWLQRTGRKTLKQLPSGRESTCNDIHLVCALRFCLNL
jgi:hypothetical protein